MNTAKHLRKQLTGVSGYSQSYGATRAALRRQLWIWPVLAALLLGGLGWWVHHSVESTMRAELAGQLTTILNADVEALHAWTADQAAMTRSVAQLPTLRPAARKLLDAPPGSPAAATAVAECRSLVGPYLGIFGYTHSFLVLPDMRIVAVNGDELPKTVLADYPQKFAQKVFHTGAAVSKPFRSIALLPDADGQLKTGVPTMFVAAPILDESGKPLALLAFRLRPDQEFSRILQTARFGQSGETYAFSDTGLLLSQSRFDDDLKRLGLLPDVRDARSILAVEVRDPQVNLMAGERPLHGRAEQPLTRLAEAAANGGSGAVMEPYRDYRGVPSVGVYRGLPEYGFCVATEVDVSDAFDALYVLRRAIWGLFTLLMLSACGIFVSMLVVARQQRRMEKAEKTIRQLGQYTLEEKIGSGGMGSVYRARHAFLRRPTAVKMLNAGTVSVDSLARFEREVQLTSKLCHPNTIAVYDYGKTPDGVFYYAMEYLEGINLEDLVKQYGPLPEARLVPILRQICGSLAEAHATGLIHRDIKPANIILTSRAGMPDFVKVLDFGLVKAADADEAAKLTQANVAVGTPHYLSPEAVENPDTVTPLSDVYAIGGVAYYLLTGTQVFTGKTIMEICMNHVRAAPEPPSGRLGRSVSAGLEGVILRCLAKKPQDRPAGTQAMADELEHVEVAGSWTRADAEAWWTAFKKPGEDRMDKAPTAVPEATQAAQNAVQEGA
jgi:hypothetical protein